MAITPEWISSVGTVLAFGVTLAALLREMSLRRRSERDDEVRQARLVLVTEPVVAKASVGDGPAEYVRVINYSAEPVHEVVVRVASGPSMEEQTAQRIELRFLAPGENQEFEFRLNDAAASGVSMESPQVSFLDSAGRRWNRTAGDYEPRRVFDYLPPGLESFLAELAPRRADRASIIGRLCGRIARSSRSEDRAVADLD